MVQSRLWLVTEAPTAWYDAACMAKEAVMTSAFIWQWQCAQSDLSSQAGNTHASCHTSGKHHRHTHAWDHSPYHLVPACRYTERSVSLLGPDSSASTTLVSMLRLTAICTTDKVHMHRVKALYQGQIVQKVELEYMLGSTDQCACEYNQV